MNNAQKHNKCMHIIGFVGAHWTPKYEKKNVSVLN
jgi:hypothetical protein